MWIGGVGIEVVERGEWSSWLLRTLRRGSWTGGETVTCQDGG